MPVEFWTTLLGAIVGAVAAGAISYVLQRKQLHHSERARRAEKIDRETALALSLFYKLVKVYSDLHNYSRHLEEPFEHLEKTVIVHPWQIVLPIANLVSDVTFSADEMSTLLRLGDHELFQQIVSLDEVHNTTTKSFETHRVLRTKVTDKLGPASELEGGAFKIEGEILKSVHHELYAIDHLIEQLRPQCAGDAADAFDALERYTKRINEEFGLNLSVALKAQ